MSTTTTQRSDNAPSHEIFAVSRREPEGKGIWNKVGAAWPHKDGDGFNMRLEFLPLAGQELVIRKWKPKPEAEAAETEAKPSRKGGAK